MSLVDLASSPEWAAICRVAKAFARRFAPRHLCEDVVAESKARMLEVLASGQDVHNLIGFTARVVRSVVKYLRRQECRATLDAADVRAPAARVSFDELVSRPGLPCDVLRSRKQRLVVAGVCEGLDCATIALQLGLTKGAVRRQLRRATSKILGY